MTMEYDELETVQFKFASIIGGLCGKPKILSQFAVWLDLRLAEYKLKGAISLDCSGCPPDPDWMQGIKPDVTYPPVNHDTSPLEPHQVQEKTTPYYTKVTEDDIRSAKQEADTETIDSNEVFMVSIDPNRPSTSQEKNSFPVKKQRLSGTHRDSHIEMTGTDESQISEISPTVKVEVENSRVQGEGHSQHSDPEKSLRAQASRVEHSTSLTSEPSLRGNFPLFSASDKASCSSKTSIRHYDNTSRRSRLPDHKSLPVKTVRNMVAAVGSFERWLWAQPYEERREIQEIPPRELDTYLCEYFAKVTKPSGDDYTPASFVSLRASMDRFLKEMNYPEFIVNSILFKDSIKAFRLRRSQLALEQLTVNQDLKEDL